MLGFSSAFPAFQSCFQGEASPKTTVLLTLGPLSLVKNTLSVFMRGSAGTLRHSAVLDGWFRCPHTLKHISLLNSLQYINFY